MLSFLKSKPILRDLIPQGYTDIHSHFLFGIDDGASTLEDSNYLLQSVADFGFTKCITTPHTIENVWDNTPEIIQNKKEELIRLSPELTAKVSLEAASEYMINDAFVKLFQEKKLLTLKGSHVLVEIPYLSPPIHLPELLFQLQLAGYIPVLAHPERYAYYHNNFNEYKKLKKAGCLFQLNLLSTVGYYGKEVMQTADKLLQNGLIDFSGSDIHHKKHIESFSDKIRIKDKTPLIEAMKNNSFFQ